MTEMSKQTVKDSAGSTNDSDFVYQGSAVFKEPSRESIERELESRFYRTAVYGTVRTVV